MSDSLGILWIVWIVVCIVILIAAIKGGQAFRGTHSVSLLCPFFVFPLITNTVFCYNQLVIPLEETHTAYMVLLSLIRQATLLEITQQTSHPIHCHQAIMVLHTHHHQLIILDHHLRQCRNQTVAQSSTCHPRLIRTILKIWDYRNQTKLTSKYLIISNKDLIISCSKV